MSYEILEKRLDGLNIITKVRFTFDDSSTMEVDVTHYQPQSKEDVIRGIENREESEYKLKTMPEIIRGVFNEIS